MAKAEKALLVELAEAFERHAQGLPAVEKKTMFGCDGYFRSGQVFGLIWKEGRIGVRLPEAESFSALMDERGSAPWKAGPMVMRHWVLVPPGWHGDAKRLKEWIATAHTQAANGATKSSKATAKSAKSGGKSAKSAKVGKKVAGRVKTLKAPKSATGAKRAAGAKRAKRP